MPEKSALCKGIYMSHLLNPQNSKFVQIYSLEEQEGPEGPGSLT